MLNYKEQVQVQLQLQYLLSLSIQVHEYMKASLMPNEYV